MLNLELLGSEQTIRKYFVLSRIPPETNTQVALSVHIPFYNHLKRCYFNSCSTDRHNSFPFSIGFHNRKDIFGFLKGIYMRSTSYCRNTSAVCFISRIYH